ADLAVLHSYSSTISMWMNDGAGGFTSAGRYQSGSSVDSFEIVPSEIDPRPTIVSADRSGARFLLLGVDLAGNLAAPPVYPVGQDARSIAAGDFDGNGAFDLAVATQDGIAVIANPKPRQSPQPQPQSLGAATRASWVASADVTGDGKVDLVGAQGGVFVAAGRGDGTFAAPAAIPGGSSTGFVAAADLNGDSRMDLFAVENRSPAGAVAVYLAGTGGSYSRTAYSVGASPAQAAAADFNGDGTLDLVVANSGTLQSAAGVSLLLSSGPGVYRPATALDVGLSLNTVAAGDFNGDGKQDFAAAGQLEGAPSYLFGLRVFLGAGDGSFRALPGVETTFGPVDMKPGDFNGDGFLDLAMSHCCGTTDMTMLLGNGDGTFGQIPFPGGASPQGLATGDFDGNGRLDLAVAGGDSQAFSGGTASILTFDLQAATHVNAASGSPGVQAPDSIVSAYGLMLATATDAAPSPDWPTVLAGTRVRVRDSAGVEREAGIAFASSGQVNYHMPAETAEGAATVTITTGAGREISTEVVIRRVAAGFFQATPGGLAAAWVIRVKPDGTQLLEPVVMLSSGGQVVGAPIDLSVEGDVVVLQLFGTGLRGRQNLSDVRVTIGGVDCSVLYAGPQNQFPGLDQLNVQLPASLRGAGVVDVVVEIEGGEANVLQVRIR
ncbi:MAG: VCBS repeat-containing protein, partial [Acidobacteria bacterium]|nr:VCBS repeat-containing protein [Acidobacteriota bacterium]